jgi:hypothetical protein
VLYFFSSVLYVLLCCACCPSPPWLPQELSDTKDKFETGLGESRFYHGLARQAQSMSPPAVGQFLEEMRGGLELMQRHLGSESPLIAAALR